MKKSAVIALALICLVALVEDLRGQAAKLPPRHKQWLEEEVVYIITPLEREVFQKLTTDRERDLFIEAFWKQRDHVPGTQENEFKTEHFRRITHANKYYGRTGPKPGWKTDRGRIYIILGEPMDIQRFDGKTQTYPAEIWFYQGKTDLGLPAAFNVVFFQQGGVGEYRLYSPTRDGPQALLTSYQGDPIDYYKAYENLREFEPELANVSLSLIPGEDSVAFGRPSLASDLLIQRIETTPTRLVEEKYAQKFLEYKDIVEVEYTANYIDCDSLVKVIKDPTGVYFVHFIIEPQRLSVNSYGNKYYTTLKVNGSVNNLEGRNIFQFERTMNLEFDEEKMKSISRQPMDIHDMFPLIPGIYKVSILVKNEASKEFTSLERTVQIPGPETALQMTSLILGHKINPLDPGQKRTKPFVIGTWQVYAQPSRLFLKKDSLALAFQVHGLSPEVRSRMEARYVISREGETVRSFSRKLSDYRELPNILEEFSLSDFSPAHYSIRVALVVDGREVLSESDEFGVTHLEFMPRPWVYTKVFPDSTDPVYAYMIGTQLFNNGRIDEARVELERAVREKPESADFAVNLAKIYMLQREFGRIEPLLLPFLNQEKPPAYELFYLQGKAYQGAGELAKAVEVFDKAVSHYGVNIYLLNSLGDCYFQLGKYREALVVWGKSLELDPNQPQVKKSVEALKEKK